MEVRNEQIDEMIKFCEQMGGEQMSIIVGEYKGWNVRLAIEKPSLTDSRPPKN